MPHINAFFIAIVLNEYYQYYILSINYYLSLCVSWCFFSKFSSLALVNLELGSLGTLPKKTTLNNFANYHQNSMQIYTEEKLI